jgi:predicted transcriptional regulator
MPATSPRISAVVDQELADWLHHRAEAENRSLSTLVREILARFYAEEEERFWAREGEARLATFEEGAAIAHEDAWK